MLALWCESTLLRHQRDKFYALCCENNSDNFLKDGASRAGQALWRRDWTALSGWGDSDQVTLETGDEWMGVGHSVRRGPTRSWEP